MDKDGTGGALFVGDTGLKVYMSGINLFYDKDIQAKTYSGLDAAMGGNFLRLDCPFCTNATTAAYLVLTTYSECPGAADVNYGSAPASFSDPANVPVSAGYYSEIA